MWTAKAGRAPRRRHTARDHAEGHLRGHVPQGWDQNTVHKQRSGGQRCPGTAFPMGILEHVEVMDGSYARDAQRAPRARGTIGQRTGRVKVKHEGYFCGYGVR